MKKLFIAVLLLVLLISTGGCSSSSADSGSNESIPAPSGDSVKEPEPSDAGDEPAPVIDGDVSQGIYTEGSELSFDEFDFYDEVYENGIPDGAYYPEMTYAAGNWRYELFVYKEGTYDTGYLEVGYADLDVDEGSKAATLSLHPRISSDGYESYPMTDEDAGYEIFDGGLNEYSGLTFYGNGLDLYLSYYYAYEGREYIIGSLYKSNVLVAGLLLVRGQN